MSISSSMRRDAEALFKAPVAQPSVSSSFLDITNKAEDIREKSASLRDLRLARDGLRASAASQK